MNLWAVTNDTNIAKPIGDRLFANCWRYKLNGFTIAQSYIVQAFSIPILYSQHVAL
ncbi:MAG: hypothetical protein SWJ54_00195 [Cyanobacteriota bacterium]|nr:hypothetical protein [Cyanobacteriota bacterium]